MKKPNSPTVIGSTARIDLPWSEQKAVVARVDTGAYYATLDCSFIEEGTNQAGEKVLRYIPLHEGHPGYSGEVIETTRYHRMGIRNTSGTQEKRYLVRLNFEIDGVKYMTRCTLANRGSMRFPILLGRLFLHYYNILVDVNKTWGDMGEGNK